MGINKDSSGAFEPFNVEKEKWRTKFHAAILLPLESEFFPRNWAQRSSLVCRKNRPRLQSKTDVHRAGGNCTPCILQHVDSWTRCPKANARGNHTTWHCSTIKKPKVQLLKKISKWQPYVTALASILLTYLRASIPELASQHQLEIPFRYYPPHLHIEYQELCCTYVVGLGSSIASKCAA